MAYTAIDDPSAHFQTVLYTGNGSANLAITNGGNSDLQPDLVWIKNRVATDSHCLFDSTRGATKVIHSDVDTAESTDTDTLDSFASDGFQVDADVKVNTNTEAYVAWQWKANGGSTSSNTNGSITSTVQTNTTAGFSIGTYTGTADTDTVGHGLGATVDCVIVKHRDGTSVWEVYHSSLTENNNLELSNNAAINTIADYWGTAVPNATVFGLPTGGYYNNIDDGSYIFYAFTSIQGYSKFGSYVGNNDADGPFIYLGFKPAYFLLKSTDITQHWYVFDTARDTYNTSNSAMQVSGSAAQETGYPMDFLSNGFKIRHNDGAWNGSDNSYIYMAFAEHPFVSSGGVPCTAR